MPREAIYRCPGSRRGRFSLPRVQLLSCIVGGLGPSLAFWKPTAALTAGLCVECSVPHVFPNVTFLPPSVPLIAPPPPVCSVLSAPSSVPGIQKVLKQYWCTEGGAGGDLARPVHRCRPEKTSWGFLLYCAQSSAFAAFVTELGGTGESLLEGALRYL